jgi:hypothetical protein
MLEPPHIFDERATTYATGTNCSNILTDEMHGLYLFSFLLTADLDKAEQCFVSELGECKEEIGVSWRGRKHGLDARFSGVRFG